MMGLVGDLFFTISNYAHFDRDTLRLEWSIGTIRIRGPKAEIFFDKFATVVSDLNTGTSNGNAMFFVFQKTALDRS